MTNSVSGETGENLPARKESEPDPLAFIVNFLDELGTDGVNAVDELRLAARDLRIAYSSHPRELTGALSRADQLDGVKAKLEELLIQANETVASSVPESVRPIGRTALSHQKQTTPK